MSGIVGIRRFDGRPVDPGLLAAMIAQLRHRGPDGEGRLIAGRIGFGHARLSIIDVAGPPQPMRSADGGALITLDGEVFNYQDLRRDLLAHGIALRTQGDAEVLLETLRLHGVAGLARVNGQFAFGYHDPATDDLWLARDRLGILPLYYAEAPGFVAFASEIKALLPALGAARLDDDAVEDYLTFRSVPPPRTLFAGVRKLPPGTVLRVGGDGRLREEVYWALPPEPSGAPLRGERAIAEVAAALERAVALRLVADVPVGACLGGGLDSSLVVALMKRLRHGDEVQTFSAGFADPRFDELPYARQASALIGTVHHEVMVAADDFRDLWSRLTWHRDGPIGEPADVAIYRIATVARRSVKVLLSGEGSDELFGGHPKYTVDRRLRALAALPAGLRVPLFRVLERHLPASQSRARIAARALTARTAAERMQTWFAPFTWYERAALRHGYGGLRDPGPWARARGDHLRRMLYGDCHGWLADNLLERGDRMSMAAGIEHRPPFLDHELVELAFRVDSGLKVRGGQGKRIVKEVAQRHLPRTIVDRRKLGFRVPLDEWFRGGLKDYAHDLLLGRGSFVAGYLARTGIERLLADHVSGRRNEASRLWTLLGFEVFCAGLRAGHAVSRSPVPAGAGRDP